MSRQLTREIRSHRAVGTFFEVEKSDLAALGGAFSGDVALALSKSGEPITAPWVAPGYRVAVLGDSFVPALLAVRALAAGASVVVVTVSPAAWQQLGRTLGEGTRLQVLDPADAAQLKGLKSDLVISDMPYTFDWIAREWDGRCALVTVMAAPDARADDIVRACQLVVVTAAALPAEAGSVVGSLLGPEYSGLHLPEDRAFLRAADETIHEIGWSWTPLEAQALGIR